MNTWTKHEDKSKQYDKVQKLNRQRGNRGAAKADSRDSSKEWRIKGERFWRAKCRYKGAWEGFDRFKTILHDAESISRVSRIKRNKTKAELQVCIKGIAKKTIRKFVCKIGIY